jgi:hypothetical protein
MYGLKIFGTVNSAVTQTCLYGLSKLSLVNIVTILAVTTGGVWTGEWIY